MYVHENLVVVGVDGSESALAALRWAAAVARNRGAELRAVTCYQPGPDPEASRVGAESIAHESLAKTDTTGLKISVHVEAGSAGEVLVEQSKIASRVVVGYLGADTTGGAEPGPVAAYVTTRAYCATVVVPRTESTRLPIRHIVVGVDGSTASRYAVELAVRMAGRWGAKLSAINSVHVESQAGMLVSPELAKEVLEDTRVGLEETVQEIMTGKEQVEVKCYAVEGSAARLLGELSSSVDLVVVGTRGRSGVAQFIFGSTAQGVLRNAKSPVVVVPARAAENVHAPNTNVPWEAGF